MKMHVQFLYPSSSRWVVTPSRGVVVTLPKFVDNWRGGQGKPSNLGGNSLRFLKLKVHFENKNAWYGAATYRIGLFLNDHFPSINAK